MEATLGASIRAVNIDASPRDVVPGEGWMRAMTDAPWLSDEHRRRFEGIHPHVSTPQTTTVRVNHRAWDSMSSYMVEMAMDDAATTLTSLMVDGSVVCLDRSAYAAAEAADAARPVPLFAWERPLLRLGVHVVAHPARTEAGGVVDALEAEFGQVVVTRRGGGIFSFLAAGPQPYATHRAGSILQPEVIARPLW